MDPIKHENAHLKSVVRAVFLVEGRDRGNVIPVRDFLGAHTVFVDVRGGGLNVVVVGSKAGGGAGSHG